jgi:hypothetical protein
MSEGAAELVDHVLPDFPIRQWVLTVPFPAELLRRVFGIEILCTKCKAPLRLIALIKSEATAKKILDAMHLPSEVPRLHLARPPPTARQEACGAEDWVN